MDKRTLIFVFSLSLTLMLVNWFFEGQRRESNQEWSQQQSVIKEKKVESLKLEISVRTAKAAELPLVSFYSDRANTQILSTGVLVNDSILTISWDTTLPSNIFAKQGEYKLVHTPSILGGPAIYQRGAAKALPISTLPHFGNYELQLVATYPKSANTKIFLGDFTDGHFSIPQVKLDQIKTELKTEEVVPTEIDNAIVIQKTPQGYRPVAIYLKETKSLVFLDQIEGLDTLAKRRPIQDVITAKKPGEQYYVLENDYQQLVFSNVGASLVELNLPFKTETNEKSIVKEIKFDRDMVKDHPYNALFPSKPYFTAGEPEEHPEGNLGGYYPLLRRDLLEVGNRKSIRILPRYYAMNIVSEYPEMAETQYELKHFDKNSITFETSQRNRQITKTYSFDEKAPYIVNLTIKVEGDSRGLWLTSGIPEVEWISNATAPALKYRITRNQKSEVINLDKPKESVTVSTINPDWICNSNGFLGLIIDPLTEIDPGYRTQYVAGTVVPSRLIKIDQEYDRYKAADLPGYLMMLPLKGQGGIMKFRIFAGPFSEKALTTADQAYSDPVTGYNPDYISSQSFHGWFAFISAPFTKLLFILMKLFYSLTGSWGFSIILLTLALRIMLYPLNAWTAKSTLRMQEIAPEIQRIQAKYKKDPKKSQLEIMNLYRDKGVNPVSGCFPMLIQMPFLIGMFDLLKSTFELRGASFIPGWIDNLAAPDVLFSWDTPIFFIGTEFHLLPVLLGCVMFLQQRIMSPAPVDPSNMTEQQRQQRTMGTVMTVVFSIMFYNFPSGLNLYWR